MTRPPLAACILAAFSASSVGACGSTKPAGFVAPDDAASPLPDPDKGKVPPELGPGPSDAGMFVGDVAAPTLEAVVYGQSADTLYRLDPTTKAVTVVGAFEGCGTVLDIALDSASKMYGTTSDTLWTIDRFTAKCTAIAKGSDYPNSLSFVPKGTLDPNGEALVGYKGSDYVRIDTTTGAVTKIGQIGSGLSSSGDIVSVKGGATYLTVKGTACNSRNGDCLIEVDPATGALKNNWGNINHADVFGLAFWAGTVYGFDQLGELFEVSFKDGKVSATDLVIPKAPDGLSFFGAGSTTSAPVVAPR